MSPLDIFKVEARKITEAIRNLYSYALKMELYNSLEFINWQDIMNAYSLLPSEDASLIGDTDGDSVFDDLEKDNSL